MDWTARRVDILKASSLTFADKHAMRVEMNEAIQCAVNIRFPSVRPLERSDAQMSLLVAKMVQRIVTYGHTPMLENVIMVETVD